VLGGFVTADLVAFLRARLEETAAKATAATPGPWEWIPGKDGWDTQNGPTLIRAGHDGEGDRELTEVLAGWGHDAWGMDVSEADAAHIAHHNPAFVLANVGAQQRFLDQFEQLSREAASSDYLVRGPARIGLSVLESVLRLHALPYVDHPNYKPEWKPGPA
jgi:hypothetical protein